MRLIFVNQRLAIVDASADDLSTSPPYYSEWQVFTGLPGASTITRLMSVWLDQTAREALMRDPDVRIKGERYHVAAIAPPDTVYVQRVD